MTETKKAFRTLEKRNDLESAILNLSNLKVKNYKSKNYSFKNNFSNFWQGVGPAFASAVLAAFAPDRVPFMSDECLLSMPDCEEVDYTMKEYNKMLDEVGAL